MNNSISPHYAFASYFDQGKLFPFLYMLSQKMAEGNICLDIRALDKVANAELDSQELDFTILDYHSLVGTAQANSPFIFHLNKLYLHRFFHYEGKLLQQIKALINQGNSAERLEELANSKDFLFGNLFQKSSEIDWQLVACVCAYIHQFCIITGGPGTGKTTTVSKLLVMILQQSPHVRIVMAAPTGKAAARMKESQAKVHQHFSNAGISAEREILDKIATLEASTIHSLLGYIPNSIHFKHNADNPIDAEVVIIDECSMIDIALFKKLLTAIDSTRTKLILLGDKNQLASVEAGSIFGDLCSSIPTINTFDSALTTFIEKHTGWDVPTVHHHLDSHLLSGHIVELQKSFRFDDAAGIGRLSKAVLHSNLTVIDEFVQNRDAQIQILPFEETVIEDFARKLIDKKNGYFHESDVIQALKKINNSKIICAVKQGKYGVFETNLKVEQFLQAHTNNENMDIFYENKLIMVTKNQADVGIFNGDIGIVRWIEDASGQTQKYVCFWKNETSYLKILPGNIDTWETAYAMTIHKSQGSEFDELLIILPNNEKVNLLTKELMYTAITRAKSKATILTDIAILQQAARQSVQRISGIQERIEELKRGGARNEKRGI